MNLLPHQRDAVVRAEEILARYGGVILADDIRLGEDLDRVVAALYDVSAEEQRTLRAFVDKRLGNGDPPSS